tara:strand:- start:1215 stop:1481 length:267 start_codon:yes stop_codon:yes gene_type:complete
LELDDLYWRWLHITESLSHNDTEAEQLARVGIEKEISQTRAKTARGFAIKVLVASEGKPLISGSVEASMMRDAMAVLAADPENGSLVG